MLVEEGQMKTTRYFEEQVLRKRPYLKREWCEQALRNPARREVQPDVFAIGCLWKNWISICVSLR